MGSIKWLVLHLKGLPCMQSVPKSTKSICFKNASQYLAIEGLALRFVSTKLTIEPLISTAISDNQRSHLVKSDMDPTQQVVTE